MAPFAVIYGWWDPHWGSRRTYRRADSAVRVMALTVDMAHTVYDVLRVDTPDA